MDEIIQKERQSHGNKMKEKNDLEILTYILNTTGKKYNMDNSEKKNKCITSSEYP